MKCFFLQLQVELLFNALSVSSACSLPCRDLAAATAIEGSVLKNILGSMLFAKDLQVTRCAAAAFSFREMDVGMCSVWNGSLLNGGVVLVPWRPSTEHLTLKPGELCGGGGAGPEEDAS